jgi:hypothetical protein
MARIVAAIFDDQHAADLAAEALRQLDLGAERVESFKLNAPGQHRGLPTGGAVDPDAAAKSGERGALAGAVGGGVVGTRAGAAVTPIAGPIALPGGLAAGAYAGSLAGALNAMGDEDKPPTAVERPAGIMVAVNVDGAIGDDVVVELLYETDATFIELAEGTWRDGQWVDFDPIAPPRQIAFDAKTH